MGTGQRRRLLTLEDGKMREYLPTADFVTGWCERDQSAFCSCKPPSRHHCFSALTADGCAPCVVHWLCTDYALIVH